ncbi:thioredoxin-disulfide reductase [Thermoplasmatales archaeon SW_10_69_26]|nr:MAG: thioredoxin-disulfide reductase [Thermoplasmatales archaeon SW_10_69_26]
MTVRDVVIVGSGPAGLTAALYNARANLDVLCIAGYEAGGQLMLTTDVENYPGFPEGIQGPDLMQKFRDQAARFGTDFIDRDATDADLSSRPFTIEVEDETVKARSVIIATGASARWLGLPDEESYRGKGISTCATCDGAFFKDKEVVVVGGGDSAMEEALFLTKFADQVTIVHRRDEFRASQIMADRALEHEDIEVLWNTEAIAYLGDPTIEGLRLIKHPDGRPKKRIPDDEWANADEHGGKVYDFATDGVFIAIGHDPNTPFLEGEIELDEKGYVEVEGHTRTDVDGVFAAGDVHDKHYRQAVTAAGLGCRAAMDTEQWLEAQDD